MNIILWVIFGAIAGWLASKIMSTDGEQGAVANIVVGIIGAIVGGFLMQLLGGSGVDGFNIRSFAVAVVGAVVFLWAFKWVRGRA